MKTLSLLAALAVTALAVGCSNDQPTSPNNSSPILKETTVAQGVKIEPIGEPIWKPTDFHFTSIEIGTAESGYAEFFENILDVLPGPNHTAVAALGVGPGTAHAAPYDGEIAAGLTALGLREAVQFKTKEFSHGNGVMLTWMNVPAPGTTGSSPDFASGPIIPNSVFPISVSGPALHNGELFDPWLAYANIPKLDGTIEARFTGLDGHSHFPMFCVTNDSFGPAGKLNGSYTYNITMLDATNNGWKITGHFAVGD